VEPQRATGAGRGERGAEAVARVHIVHPGREGHEARAPELRLGDRVCGLNLKTRAG
jgi:hypothetical protein